MMQPDVAPATEEEAKRIVLREAAAIGTAVLLHPWGWLKKSRRTPRRADQRTVVFVHGYLANGSCFTALRAYLRVVGHRSFLTYDYGRTASVDEAAIGLKKFLKKNVRGGRIDLVCHSLGGLVASSYLCELGGARRVDRCVTLGTPFRGTYNAYWLAGRMGKDLRPGSALLGRLRRARRASKGVRVTAVVGEADNIVIPRIFASTRRAVRVKGIGHTGMLFSPTVFRIVAEALRS